MGVGQPGSALWNPGFTNPSQWVHPSRIPPVIHPSPRQRNQNGQKQNFSHSLRRFFSSGSFHRRDSEFQRENPDPCPASKLPNGSQLNLRVRAALPRLLCANKQRTNRGWGEGGEEKQQPWRLPKWSSTLSPLSICAAAPRPPSPTLLQPLSAHSPGPSHWLAPRCGFYVDGRELEEREMFCRSSR